MHSGTYVAAFYTLSVNDGFRILLSEQEHMSMPPLVKIDLLAFRSIVFGFPCYTAAILLGGVFAIRDSSVGIAFTYWVALGSWLIYAFMLQARLVAGLRGQRAAKLTLLGLVGLLFVVGQYLVRGV